MTFRISTIGLVLAFAMAPAGTVPTWAQSPFPPRHEVKEDSELERPEREDDDDDEEEEKEEVEEADEAKRPDRGEEEGAEDHASRLRPTDDPAQRLHHIRLAIEHLQAAGLAQEADRVGLIAQKIERELIGIHREPTSDEHTEMREFGRILRMMHRSLRELRIAVQGLNSRVETLESERSPQE